MFRRALASNFASHQMFPSSRFAHGEKMLERTPSMEWIPPSLPHMSSVIPYEGVFDELIEDSYVKSAARLGELWHVNPIDLLSLNDDEWLILMACAKVIEQDRQEQERQSKSNRP